MSLGMGNHSLQHGPECPWLCVSMEGFQCWLTWMSSCCPLEISLEQSEHSAVLIIKKPFKSGWMGKDRKRMRLDTEACASVLLVPGGKSRLGVCTPCCLFQVLPSLWDFGSIFPLVRSSPKI